MPSVDDALGARGFEPPTRSRRSARGSLHGGQALVGARDHQVDLPMAEGLNMLEAFEMTSAG